MADDLGLGLGNINFSGAFAGIGEAVGYIIGALAVAGILWFVFWWMSFKYRVRVREIIRGRTVIFEDRARRFKDRDGVYWWKLRRMRATLPEPPSECIDINRKGKKIVELFKADDGSFIPIKVDINYDEWKKEQLTSKSSEAFKPFPSNQRAMFIHELRQSESYKKKKLSELLVTLAPYIAIVLILTIFMLFFGQVIAPMQGVADGLAGASAKLEKATDNMAEVCLGKVKLQVEAIGNNTQVLDTAPN